MSSHGRPWLSSPHTWMPSPRRWLALLLLAAATHALAVWALPRAIMARVASSATPEQRSGAYFPPMTDETSRRIVMPSPDLLYATCAIDVRERPLRVRADPRGAGHGNYWSIALYAANSDNFYVLNDTQAGTQPVDLVIVPAGSAATAPAGATVVQSPSTRGLLLMRVLVADYAREAATLEAARRSLRCAPL